MDRRHIEEHIFKFLMIFATAIVTGSVFTVLLVVLVKGAPALDFAMLTQLPQGGYYIGGEGGILNAIIGSLYLAIGATVLALIIAIPVALFLQKEYIGKSRFGTVVRFSLDILWGVPSIVYGAFGFIIMLYLGLKACLLGGIVMAGLL